MKKASISEAINRKYPEWIFMLVTKAKDGRVNAMPAGWCMFTSMNPTMLAVSVGLKRYTHGVLQDSDSFVLTYPSEVQKEAVLFCGANSGSRVDKLAETDLTTTPASKVDVPLIEESVACFECEKRGMLKSGDHRIFTGEVLAAHVSESPRKKIYNTGNWPKRGLESLRTLEEAV